MTYLLKQYYVSFLNMDEVDRKIKMINITELFTWRKLNEPLPSIEIDYNAPIIYRTKKNIYIKPYRHILSLKTKNSQYSYLFIPTEKLLTRLSANTNNISDLFIIEKIRNIQIKNRIPESDENIIVLYQLYKDMATLMKSYRGTPCFRQTNNNEVRYYNLTQVSFLNIDDLVDLMTKISHNSVVMKEG